MIELTKTNGTGREEVNLALRDLERRFGLTVGKIGSYTVEVIPTGFHALDLALGVGGFPRGRIIDIYGPEGSTKTTLCWSLIAQAQALGGMGVFIDTEHAADLSWAGKLGVDLDRLYVSQPHTGEEALEIAEAVIRAGIDVVVIDSAAALVPRAELEGEMGDNHAGLQSRLMSQAMRKLAGPVREFNSMLVFTNQIRNDPDRCDSKPTGGMAIRFHASVAISLNRIKLIKSSGEVIGLGIRATTIKNKVAPSNRSAEFELFFKSPKPNGRGQ